jgi:hypothetical protein
MSPKPTSGPDTSPGCPSSSVALAGTGVAQAHTMAASLSGCERIVPPSRIATCLSCQEGKNTEGELGEFGEARAWVNK